MGTNSGKTNTRSSLLNNYEILQDNRVYMKISIVGT